MENPKGEFVPGMFAKVRLALGEPHKALLLPESAITRGLRAETSVLIVNDKNRLEERSVTLGGRFDGLREIREGLKSSDLVIQSLRGPDLNLRPGVEVNPREEKGSPHKKPVGDGGAAAPQPLPELPVNGPALIVTAIYPGANAQTVEETVAAPISQQINGMEGLVHQFASCTNDGEMRMTLFLKKGTDLNAAQVAAQNRIALALPALPEEIKRSGITVKKRPVHLLGVAFTSPTGRYDQIYLANYAHIQIRDELAGVAGVGEVTLYGDQNPGPQLRLEIDRVRVAALGLTVNDVVSALHNQNLSTSGVADEKLNVAFNGRRADPETIGDLILKATKEGRMVRLRDVAKIELASGWNTTTSLDGKPCVLLLVARSYDADAKETAKAVRERVKKLQELAPEGLEMRLIDE
jgi:multidrug efflux pump subunit AcrB